LQWRPVYLVQFTELADHSVVYRGAPSEALESIRAGYRSTSRSRAADRDESADGLPQYV